MRRSALARAFRFWPMATSVALVLVAGCKRHLDPSRTRSGSATDAVILDAGDSGPGARWSCEAKALAEAPLQREISLGIASLPADEEALTLTFQAGDGRARTHRALVLARSASAPLEGPLVDGDAPPWVSVGATDRPRFVRLVLGGSPRWVLSAADRTEAESPLVLGDELALDALALADGRVVVAATDARGVVLRAVTASAKNQEVVLADASSPALLLGPNGALAVAVRVDGELPKADVKRDVPVAALEGSGEERSAASLVVFDAAGARLRAFPLATGAEWIGPTLARRALLVSSRRVIRGATIAAVEAVTADGKKVAVAEVPVRRGSRVFPVEDLAVATGVGSDVLELADCRLAVLGPRAGALPLGSVEAVIGARVAGPVLDVWFTRDDETGSSARRHRCTWAVPRE